MTLHDVVLNPLACLLVTIGSFVAAQWFQKKMGGYSLLNPVVISIIAVVCFIVIFDIPYADYLKNVNLIHGFLGPATVALAVPLYKQLPMICRSALAIFVSVGTACIVAAFTGYGIAHFMGASNDIQLSIIPKSATTPIAIGIAEKIGADGSLAVFFVFTTGIIGSLIASMIFKICRIKDERAIGLALGTTCHGLGVARAFQYSENVGAFAALGISLMGIISGIVLPILVMVFIL